MQMILSKLSVLKMLQILKKLKKSNIEFFDIEGTNHENQDSLVVITKESYKKIPTAPCKYKKLNDNIINSLLG